jgi:outer membrane receptor protein involved in Fe transport
LSSSARAATGSEERDFDVPSQPIVKALIEFSDQADVLFVESTERFGDEVSSEVLGRMSVQTALEALLDGTGFEGEISNDGVLTLAPEAPEPDGSTQPMTTSRRASLLAGAAAIFFAGPPAIAQDEPEEDRIVVVGSHIEGFGDSGALPVTVVTREELDVFGADSAGDMLANIPSIGDFEFRDQNTGTNGARGDVTGVSLRGLGSGHTLVLLNGRRVVSHPVSQAIGSVPVTFFNVNAIPGSMIGRVEILRDGASALYGADAIAGVVNFSLMDDYDGANVGGRYGASTEHSLEEWSVQGRTGWDLNNGQSNLTIGGSFYNRSDVAHIELEEWFGELDRRQLVPDPFTGSTRWDNRSTLSPYARFRSGFLDGDGVFQGVAVDQGATDLTSGSGLFHMEPIGFDDGVTLNDGSVDINTGSIPRGLRYNFIMDEIAIPEVDRFSGAASFTHSLENDLELFAEALYFDSTSKTARAPGPFDASLAYIIVPADNYYNPFGPVGSPNRLAGIDAPAGGLDILINGYRPVEMGPRIIEVEQDLYRVLGGIRGFNHGWEWESAIGYSESNVSDEEFNRTSKTLLQAQMELTTPDAFNPFGGPGANSAAVLDAVRISTVRAGEASMTTLDFRANRPDLFNLFGNDVGAAFGIEWRDEEIFEDSDPRLDGTTQFTTGAVPDESDVVGVSATNDFGGDRDTWSAYGELAVPIIEDGEGVPLVYALDLQLAARYEEASDYGDAFKPKAALHWFLLPELSLRGSYAEGFRAPNLVQINQGTIIRRNQGDPDPWREDVVGNANDIGDTYRPSERAGNPNLDPEESESYNIGAVYQPLAGPLDGLRIGVDWWRIETTDAIATVGVERQLESDAEARMVGSFNPAVIRAAVTPADQAAFDAWNLANPDDQRTAAGEVLLVLDSYINLDVREVEGVDYSVSYDTPEYSFGSLSFAVAATQLQTFEESRTVQGMLEVDDLIERNGNPEWRASASVGWSRGNWGAQAQARYVSEVEDTSGGVGGVDWYVDSWTTVNALVAYDFEDGWENSAAHGLGLRLGVRNLFNETPPHADESPGYFDRLHNVEGRVIYGQLSKEF